MASSPSAAMITCQVEGDVGETEVRQRRRCGSPNGGIGALTMACARPTATDHWSVCLGVAAGFEATFSVGRHLADTSFN